MHVHVCTEIYLSPREKRILKCREGFKTNPGSNVWKMHRCISQRGWPCHDWPDRTGASRTAVHGCSRVIMQVLLPVASSSPATADRRWVLTVAGVDSQRTCIPTRSSAFVSSPREPPNLLYHTECDFRYDKTMRVPVSPPTPIGMCLAFSLYALVNLSSIPVTFAPCIFRS